MCGRFYVDPDDMSDAELIALLDREKTRAQATGTPFRIGIGEVSPGQNAAVIAMNRRLQRSAFIMRWGFRGARGIIINARSETASEKPMFRLSMQDRRCLIPASAYFEWDHRQKPYQKYRFSAVDQSSLYLAGLYRFEPDAELPVFTVLTRSAAPDIACFHDRMPVMLPADLADAWLDRRCNPTSLLAKAITQTTWQNA